MEDIFMLQLFPKLKILLDKEKRQKKVVGGPCLEQEEINRLYNHSS